jgi:hypothetical protein
MIQADRYKTNIRWSSDKTGTTLHTPLDEAARFILDVKAGKYDHLLLDEAYVDPSN